MMKPSEAGARNVTLSSKRWTVSSEAQSQLQPRSAIVRRIQFAALVERREDAARKLIQADRARVRHSWRKDSSELWATVGDGMKG
jgi:hypothetical protein